MNKATYKLASQVAQNINWAQDVVSKWTPSIRARIIWQLDGRAYKWNGHTGTLKAEVLNDEDGRLVMTFRPTARAPFVSMDMSNNAICFAAQSFKLVLN